MSQLKAASITLDRSAALIAKFAEMYIPEPNSGCWLWSGNTQVKNYGVFYIGRRGYLAHRVSYTMHVGNIPDRLHVLHLCDNPCCVNPDHLYVGTHLQNMDDRAARGRSKGGGQRGTECPWAKLDETTVRRIRADKRPGSVAAREYGINSGTFYKIKRRERWSHIQ